ncbi:TonB-dependent receptor domain-containing protein [Caulobacter sp. RL271]|uniref:TonB-dependent receptor n=1 Tax=Caulobacter segnis TaxID=88688 RepID=A0ABY4ZRH0_9CAUL|nr:TonB-dependent receptor [Caulobacter segnis]USQ95186.1 TonB-dependent receptor [Caulobacter segnis]
MLKQFLAGGVAALALLACAVPAAAQQRAFDVPAQGAASAISAFARQAGLQVVAPADGLEGVRTQALKGSMDARAALRRLIEGTGLEIVSDSNGVIVLRRTATPAATVEAEPTALDTIIVTAQKREEAAQGVPISLTAFSGRAVETYRLESLRDISRLTPGLLVSSFSQSSPTIAVRGATNTFTQIGANKPVAVVIDDLFIPRNSAATFELYGLNSVQVLKGPQGTLFGRNVTGGAIVLDTGKPAFGDAAGSARVGAGDYGLKQVDGRVDIPVGEDLAFRLAGSLKQHDGYGKDRLTGREQDDLDSRSVRAQARIRAGADVEVLLGADYAQDHNGGRTLSSKAAGSDGDRRTSELGYAQAFARNQWGASSRIYWTAPVGQVTAITGYRWSQSGEDYSGTGASYRFLTGTNTQSVNRDVDDVGLFSQEIRWASPKWSRGDLVAGVYFADEDAKRQLRTRGLAAVTGVAASDVLTDQAVKTRSYAAFVDGTVHLPAAFDLTLGARYTHDEKTASLVRTDFVRPATGSFTARDLKADWSEVTPRAVLSWTPREDLKVYGSVTRGYTAGGFNTDAAVITALARPFDPETVTNYELGLKSQWLADTLRINASVFHMDYKDKQELFFNNVTRVLTITNAGQATVEGAEVEVAWRPLPWLNLSANYGLLDTVYDDFVIPGGAVNTGNPLGSSPRDKGSLAADVRIPLNGAGYVTGAISWAYTDGYYTGATKDPNLHIDSYALTNLSLGYESRDGRWMLTAWAKNLGDVDFLLTPSTQGVLAEYLGEPRTVGVMLSARF